MAGAGHNSADDELRLIIERYERLDEEAKGISDDKRDLMSEAKSKGYDAKVLRRVLALRKMKPDDMRELLAIQETYMISMGMD